MRERVSSQDLQLRHTVAWVLLCLAFTAHIIDEAAHDFLSFYNPIASAIRDSLLLPLPVFSFTVWITGLVLANLLLLAAGIFVFRGAGWTMGLSYVLAVLMIGNGLLHTFSSIYLWQPVPGVYSSPLLLAAGVFLLHATSRRRKSCKPAL